MGLVEGAGANSYLGGPRPSRGGGLRAGSQPGQEAGGGGMGSGAAARALLLTTPCDLRISSERAPTRVDLFTGASRKPNKTPRASESRVLAKLRPRAHLQRPCTLRGPRGHGGAQSPRPWHGPDTESPQAGSCYLIPGVLPACTHLGARPQK